MSSTSEKRAVITEHPARAANGYAMALIGLALGGAGALALTRALPLYGIPLIIAGGLILAGLYMLNPNQAAALTLFGAYIGSDRGAGLRWANPFALKKRVSLRDRNLNAPVLKVNDQRGNPIEIAAVVVWRVRDTAQALFQVDDYEAYVRVQAEAAIRHLAACYAYDHANDDGETDTITLRRQSWTVHDELPMAGASVVPLDAGSELHWTFV